MVGEKDLQQAVLFWASRPIRLMGNHKRTEQTRISCFYARDVIASIKMLFVWADETERWNKPRRFDKLFRVKMPRPRIEAASFTLDELTKLYAACRCNRHRLWLMLGLNCGLDRTGLATLEWSMVKGLDTDKPYVERLRHKTGVYSRHSLWMETAELLRSVEPDDRKGFVCLTAQGEPLIEDNRDAIKMGWRHLLNRCKNVSQLSYGKLRKTGAWMIKVAGGLEASEMYLAHTEMGMNKHYANRNWSKLDDALAVMRTQLLPMLADASNAVLTAA